MPLSQVGTNSITNYSIAAVDLANNSIETYTSNSGNALSFRNRIINGAMMIDQRNAGAAVTVSAASIYYTLDRWFVYEDTDGACTVQQDTVAPTGFTNSLKFTTTTADASLAANQRVFLAQRIEGFNVADLAWGSASAKTVTLSFWVRSSLTGTFGGALENGAFNRSYPFTYSISAADTWEQKSVTITGDTTGTWNTGNTVGIQVAFGLGVGTDYSSTAGSWAASNLQSATGATSVIGTLNATWYITGVQLEVGSVATPFERRPYGTELALCQRYCINYSAAQEGNPANYRFAAGFANGTSSAVCLIALPVSMRSTPALTVSSTATDYGVYQTGAVTACNSVPALSADSSYKTAAINFSVNAALTAGQGLQTVGRGTSGPYLLLTAEL